MLPFAAPDRQPRRDRRPDRAHGAPARRRIDRGRLRRRPARAAHPRRRPGASRSAASAPPIRTCASTRMRRRSAVVGRRGGPSRLRLPERERGLRRGRDRRPGLVWIGPPPAAMRAMADKSEARQRMAAAGVPVLPGYDGDAIRTRRPAAARSRADRLSDHGQGRGRRRRPRHAAGARRRRARRGARLRRRRSGARRSATRASCSSARSAARATSRSRSSPTRTAR